MTTTILGFFVAWIFASVLVGAALARMFYVFSKQEPEPSNYMSNVRKAA